jgi:phosphate starvation-inducible PhoH-like protein
VEEDFEEIVAKTPRKRTRAVKEASGGHKDVKEKFVEERTSRIFHVEPKTDNQKKFLDALKSKQLVVGEGHSGVGKSYLSCIHAANKFLKGDCRRIVLLRPYVAVGKSAGLIPGTLREKLWPLMLPMLDTLQMVLGRERFLYMLDHEEICIESVENVRGRSYRDSVVIVDETQNTTRQEINALVTRLEETSQLILIGDSRQHDMKGETGIGFISTLVRSLKQDKPTYLDKDDLDTLFNNTACVVFDENDIVRSGLTRLFCKVFDNQ